MAGVPDELVFATKPDLAIALLRAAVAAGIRAQYVTADEVYGSVALRTAARHLQLAYVVAVPANRQVTLPDHQRRACTDAARLVPATAWARMRTGTATKSAKDYDWALLTVTQDDAPADAPTQTSHTRTPDTGGTDDSVPEALEPAAEHPRGHSVLLVRRHRYTRMLAFFRAWTPGRGQDFLAFWQNNDTAAHQAIPHLHFHVAGTPSGGGANSGDVPELTVTKPIE